MKRKATDSLAMAFKYSKNKTTSCSPHSHVERQYSTTKEALVQWRQRKQAHREQQIVELQRWWRRIRRDIPVNSCDALTLESVKVCTPPEDCGKWFEIVTEDGHRIRYAANTLFSYLVSQHTHIEPLHRKPLTKIELSRLDRLIGDDTRDQHEGQYATQLLNDITMFRRKQEDLDREIVFFLEDDIRQLLRHMEDCIEDVQIRISNQEGQSTPSGEILDQMRETLQGMRRRIEITNVLHEMHTVLNDLKTKSKEDAARVVEHCIAPQLNAVSEQIGQADPDLAFDILCQLEVARNHVADLPALENQDNTDSELSRESNTDIPGFIYMDITESWGNGQPSSSAETNDDFEGVAPHAYTFHVLPDTIDLDDESDGDFVGCENHSM